MKKRLLFITLLIILTLMVSSCATQRQAQTYKQKRGLMLLDNTELPMNKKYHNQKYRKLKYRKNRNKYKKN